MILLSRVASGILRLLRLFAAISLASFRVFRGKHFLIAGFAEDLLGWDAEVAFDAEVFEHFAFV